MSACKKIDTDSYPKKKIDTDNDDSNWWYIFLKMEGYFSCTSLYIVSNKGAHFYKDLNKCSTPADRVILWFVWRNVEQLIVRMPWWAMCSFSGCVNSFYNVKLWTLLKLNISSLPALNLGWELSNLMAFLDKTNVGSIC